MSAVHLAVMERSNHNSNSLEKVRLLIQRGMARSDIRDAQDKTPMYYVFTMHTYRENISTLRMLQLFLEEGGFSVDAYLDGHRNRALHLVQHPSVCMFLLNCRANAYVYNNQDLNPADKALEDGRLDVAAVLQQWMFRMQDTAGLTLNRRFGTNVGGMIQRLSF